MNTQTMSNSALISSDQIAGTEVYGTDGKHIGDIDSLVIEKASGRVVYAMMSFGGFLGLGERQYPVPWGTLHYDPAVGGYRTALTKEQLEGAPPFQPHAWDDREWNTRIYAHYNLPPFV